MMEKEFILKNVGKKFGKITIVKFIRMKKEQRIVLGHCECGTIKEYRFSNLKNGQVSCGLCRKNRKTLPEYLIWKSMRQRCNNIKNIGFASYGGRGISVCERWNDFEMFLLDMGSRPSELHSIDRINNDGNYEPSNCKWSDSMEQSRNTSRTIKIKINDEEMCLKDACLKMGISYSACVLAKKRGVNLLDYICIRATRV